MISSPLTTSTAQADQLPAASPSSSACLRRAIANGSVATRPTTVSAATTPTMRTHHQPGTRSAQERPRRLKPSQHATASDTASEDQLQTRAQRA